MRAQPRRHVDERGDALERHLARSRCQRMTSQRRRTRASRCIRLDRDIDGAAPTCSGDQRGRPICRRASGATRPTARSIRRCADPDHRAELRHQTAVSSTTPRHRTRAEILADDGIGEVDVGAARCRRCASSSIRARSSNTHRARDVAPRSPRPTPMRRRSIEEKDQHSRSTTTTNRPAADFRPLVVAIATARRALTDIAQVNDSVEICATPARQRQAGGARHPLSLARRTSSIRSIASWLRCRNSAPRSRRPSTSRWRSIARHDPCLTLRRRAQPRHLLAPVILSSRLLAQRTALSYLRRRAGLSDRHVRRHVLLHYSTQLSLMALTVATGSSSTTPSSCWRTSRACRAGMPRYQAACRARGSGFHRAVDERVRSSPSSPDPLHGGIVGRLFREFAMTLSIAVAVSLVVS